MLQKIIDKKYNDNDNKNTYCYIVTHQSYIYACGCGRCSSGEEDYKDSLLDNFEVLGAFSTEKLAKKFIKKHCCDNADGANTEKQYVKAQQEWHYNVLTMQIDNPEE